MYTYIAGVKHDVEKCESDLEINELIKFRRKRNNFI